MSEQDEPRRERLTPEMARMLGVTLIHWSENDARPPVPTVDDRQKQHEFMVRIATGEGIYSERVEAMIAEGFFRNEAENEAYRWWARTMEELTAQLAQMQASLRVV